jgi:DNA-binding PadR family transcriptional regulator
LQKRRALSAKEIGSILSNEYGLKVKKANLYFHLQKLEDLKLLQIVDTTRTGKRFTSYYGRTAGIFLSEDDLKVMMYKIFNEENFKILIERLNNDVLPDEFANTIKELNKLNLFDMSVFDTWTTNNQTILGPLDIELYEFFRLFSIIYRFSKTVGVALNHLSQMTYYDKEILVSSDQIFHRDLPKTDETIILTQDQINEYWKTVPIIKIFPNLIYTKILGSKSITDTGTIIRSGILKVMQEGVLDKQTANIRQALTAKEILDKMNEPLYLEIIDLQTTLQKVSSDRRFDRESLEVQIEMLGAEVMKKSNLYFHLQKLESEGFVKEIGFVKTGKRHTTYYGVTAKLFSPTNFADRPTYSIIQEKSFLTLIKEISPKVDLDKTMKVLEEIKSLNEYHVELFQMWTQMFDEELSDLELDYSELSKLMMLTIRFDTKTISNLAYLAEVLRIPQLK